jgi:pilus assembly protein Flp/PilA
MKNLVNRLWQEEEGQDLVEYGLLLVLIALVAVASITIIGSSVSNIFANAASVTNSAAS